MPDQVEKELVAAVDEGIAPQFEATEFEISESKFADGRRKKRVSISMNLDGQAVSVTKELIIEPDSQRKYRPCLFNLIEEAIKENLQKRWPEFERKLNNTKAVNHAVHEMKSGKECIISVSMHISVPFGKKRLRPLHVRGVDETDARLSMLITAYHWVIWQLKVIEKKKAKKKKS